MDRPIEAEEQEAGGGIGDDGGKIIGRQVPEESIVSGIESDGSRSP